MRRLLVILLLVSTQKHLCAQTDSTLFSYSAAYDYLDSALAGLTPLSVKEAVYVVENTYLDGRIPHYKYEGYIHELVSLAKNWEKFNGLKGYRGDDSVQVLNNYAIYRVLKDTIKIIGSDNRMYLHLPYDYDFDDYDGEQEWTAMFVTKLLAMHKGNCHSLPLLYKIMADDMAAPCWLALAPNHMYIKNRCKGMGWYNTELTSGCFPIDAWIMASGYLPVKAIKSGIYMDTLSSSAAISLCVIDLAKGYERKTHDYYNGFILKCCDLALKYYPVNVQALLLKAETLKRMYERTKDEWQVDDKETFHKMERIYGQLYDLGYREMPQDMYQQWLNSVMKDKEKYRNKSVFMD
jgi:hypothetical protein